MHFKLIAFNGRYIHSCLALFYVREALEKNLPDCQPEIIQYTINDPYYPILRRISSDRPAALLFSVYIWNSMYIQRLVGDLVKLLPDTPIILGGPQAKALARNLSPAVGKYCTVVAGEIEGVEQSFYQDLVQNKLQNQYSSARVSAFKSPYRAEDFAGQLRNRQVYYESSRGCPFGCTYCLSSADKGVHHLPAEQVYEETKAILRSTPKVVRFVDRTFNDLPERTLDIWRFLADQPGETLFHFEMAPDRFTEEMFTFLTHVRAGRFQFELGIQSTNPRTLEAINRKCDLPKINSNIRRLVALDSIHIHLDLILGLPYDTRESYVRSFADVFKLGPHHIQMGLLKVLPDTPISRSIEEYGMVICENPPYEILANRWLAPHELEELFWFGECVEAFYNNRYFRGFWNYLCKTGEDITTFFKELLALCHEKGFFELARTQELLSSLMSEMILKRQDRDLLSEILVFDWLRCGHQFLPPHLDREPISRHKKRLWRQMPQNWAGIYDYRSRDEFFKQGVFVPFSEEFLQQAGITDAGKEAYICFQPKREETVFRLHSFLIIPGTIWGA